MGNFGLATDGDADRIGAMDERGNFVDPHKIMALALRYLVEKRGWRGAVVRTVSTTRMIDRLAKRYGLTLLRNPGWLQPHRRLHDEGRCADRRRGIGRDFLQGAYPRRRWRPDGPAAGRDGCRLRACSLYELVEDLLEEVGPAFYERTDLRLSHPVAKDADDRTAGRTKPRRASAAKASSKSADGRGQVHHGG